MSDRAALEVAIEVAGERVRIDPGGTRIEIRANAAWALDVQFHAASGSAAVQLAATLDGRTWHRLSNGARLATGTPTGGWRAFDVAYGLLGARIDGNHHGVVVYTLTQP